MVKKKTLSEEIAELTNPAPQAEFDPEFDDKNQFELKDEELSWQDGFTSRSKKAEEKKLLLRGDIHLDDKIYSGKRTTRASMFGEQEQGTPKGASGGLDEGSDDEAEGSQGEDEEEDSGDDGLGSDGFLVDSSSEGDEGGPVAERAGARRKGKEKDAEGPVGKQEKRKAKGGARGDMEGKKQSGLKRSLEVESEESDEQEEEEEGEEGEEEEEGEEGEESEEGTSEEEGEEDAEGGKLEGEDDDEEFNASGPALLAPVSTRENARAAAVRAQRRLYEAVLELRILSQRMLLASRRLPKPGLQPLLRAEKRQPSSELAPVMEGYTELQSSLVGMLSELLDLQAAVLVQNPSTAPVLQAPGARSSTAANKRARTETNVGNGDNGSKEVAKGAQPSSSELWNVIEARHQSLAPFRDTSLDRWHRRAVLVSGGAALKGNLRALHQSISSQVGAILRDPTKLVARTQLPANSCPRSLGTPKNESESGQEGGNLQALSVPEDGVQVGVASAQGRDPETFDDAEFYSSLLREFLESGGQGGQPVSHRKRTRKNVDRRASKGRKIRYTVQEKLVNFMAPVSREAGPLALQLFANLFGRA